MSHDPDTVYQINQRIATLEPQVDAAWSAYQAAQDDMDTFRRLHDHQRAHAQWQVCLALRQEWDELEDELGELTHERYQQLLAVLKAQAQAQGMEKVKHA